MLVDGALAGSFDDVASRARELEAEGYGGAFTAETSHDPFLPLAIVAEHTEQMEIGTEDAHRMCIRLAREEGLLVGVSSGANMVAALRAAERIKEGVVVTIFCDSAAKYLSESFWLEADSQAENWP